MEDIRADLKRHGAARTRALAKARDESAEIARLVNLARSEGMSKVEIARVAGISRPALDTMLKD